MNQFYLYAASNNAFYPAKAPDDALQITEEKHREVFTGQENGLAIVPSKTGYPMNARQGKPYEIWDKESESWLVDAKLMKEHEAQERSQKILQKHEALEGIERAIARLERIKDLTESEQEELDRLIDESISLYREIKALEAEE